MLSFQILLPNGNAYHGTCTFNSAIQNHEMHKKNSLRLDIGFTFWSWIPEENWLQWDRTFLYVLTDENNTGRYEVWGGNISLFFSPLQRKNCTPQHFKDGIPFEVFIYCCHYFPPKYWSVLLRLCPSWIWDKWRMLPHVCTW